MQTITGSPTVGTQTFTYDHRDRLTSWQATGVNESYSYDLVGNITSKGGASYTYDYNRPAGAGGPYALLSAYGSSYSYDANGNILGGGGGGGRSYTWNTENQPTSITTSTKEGVTETYTYDADNARVKREKASGNTTTTYYLGSMYEEDVTTGVGTTTRTMYTFNGQVIAQREIAPNSPTPTPTPTNTPTNTATNTPKANTGPGTGASPGTGAGAGAGADKPTSTTTATATATTGKSNPKNGGAQPTGITSVNTLIYLHSDQLGSVGAATSSTGQLVSSQEYDPWGRVRMGGVAQTKLNYTGQKLDDTGLLFYNARYYDPTVGRFASADSIVPDSAGTWAPPSSALVVDFHEKGFLASSKAENSFILDNGFLAKQTDSNGPSNPQTLNRYSYVLSNPLRYTDPTGHQHCTSLCDAHDRHPPTTSANCDPACQAQKIIDERYVGGSDYIFGGQQGINGGKAAEDLGLKSGGGGVGSGSRAAANMRALGLEGIEFAGKSYNSGLKALQNAGFVYKETTKTGRKVYVNPKTGALVYYDSGNALAPGQKPHWEIHDSSGRAYDRSGRPVDTEDNAKHIPAGP